MSQFDVNTSAGSSTGMDGVSRELMKVIAGRAINGDPVLAEILVDLQSRTSAIAYAADFGTRSIPWISESCKELLGYPASDFLNGGPDFMFSVTEPDLIPGIIRQQIGYVTDAKAPGFDPRSPVVHDFRVAIRTSDQRIVQLKCLCMMLTYTVSADFDFGICLLIPPTDTFEAECKETLIRLKERHNQVYIHPAFTVDETSPLKVHGTSEMYDKKITKRETEVLELLAQGYSTREISGKLNISLNTIETHRKHLLEKFESKNTAELIKKASKVIWLK